MTLIEEAACTSHARDSTIPMAMIPKFVRALSKGYWANVTVRPYSLQVSGLHREDHPGQEIQKLVTATMVTFCTTNLSSVRAICRAKNLRFRLALSWKKFLCAARLRCFVRWSIHFATALRPSHQVPFFSGVFTVASVFTTTAFVESSLESSGIFWKHWSVLTPFSQAAM